MYKNGVIEYLGKNSMKSTSVKAQNGEAGRPLQCAYAQRGKPHKQLNFIECNIYLCIMIMILSLHQGSRAPVGTELT